MVNYDEPTMVFMHLFNFMFAQVLNNVRKHTVRWKNSLQYYLSGTFTTMKTVDNTSKKNYENQNGKKSSWLQVMKLWFVGFFFFTYLSFHSISILKDYN